MAEKHDWHEIDGYLRVHDRWLDDLSYFVLDNQLKPDITEEQVFWSGTLYCDYGIEIEVTKRQETYRHPTRGLMVRTAEYRYHATWLNPATNTRINLLRYDNRHAHEGHPDAHHKHNHDEYGNAIRPAVHIGKEWPTLGEFIFEVQDLWQQRGPRIIEVNRP